MGSPTISIITISFNAGEHIRQCIESVLTQTYPHVEYITIDAASTDGTAEILSAYEDRFSYHISEPDTGIADAMNKGLAAASGDLIYFLHADDYLLDSSSIARAVAAMDPRVRIHLFDILLSTDSQTTLARTRGTDWRLYFKNGIYHQACFCTRELFAEIGGFDDTFRIAMDYDWFLRAFRRGIVAKRYPMHFSVMRTSGISNRRAWPALQTRFGEERRVQRKNRWGVSFWPVHFAFWSLYLPYRFLRESLRTTITATQAQTQTHPTRGH